MGDRSLPDRLADAGLAELWRRCHRAMARPGDWETTTIRLPVDDDAQRRALAGLLGRPVRRGTATVGIRLADLDARLRAAGDGWDLIRVVEAVNGPLPDRAAEARERADAIEAARERARAEAAGDWVEPWLEDLSRGMLARLHTRGELALVPQAARVLARLPAGGTSLQALASSLTGDPKALSATTLEGLVLRGLAAWLDEERPTTAGERRMLWEAVGVVTDDLASQVLVLGLRTAGDDPLNRWLAEAADLGWPLRVTLHQLTRSHVTLSPPETVHVCENPTVLRTAAERLGPASAALVCTEGRPSVACVRLLETLSAAGCELRVHADLDWAGLRIAGALLALPGARPWRMGAADYRVAVDALDGRATAGARLTGTSTSTPWDPALERELVATGRVVYEEDVLETLLADLAASA